MRLAKPVCKPNVFGIKCCRDHGSRVPRCPLPALSPYAHRRGVDQRGIRARLPRPHPRRDAHHLLPEFTAAQVARARELLADGGLISTNRAGVYQSVSSDGATTYLTHRAGCTCPAGTRGNGRTCYHRAAARILGATGKAA